MYHLYAFNTQNSFKIVYILEEMKADYDLTFVNLFKGEHKSEDFLKLNPFGKVPTLQVGADSIFESGAICRFVAHDSHSPLYPQDALQRAKVDQWMDFFSIHLGKWLSTLFFENIIKPKADFGPRNDAACEEAYKFIAEQMAVLDNLLSKNSYLTGEQISIADLFAFAYVEQVETYEFSWQGFPHVKAWYDKMNSRDSIKSGREKLNKRG